MENNRKLWEDTILYLLYKNPKLVFYGHLLASCGFEFDDNLPNLASVSFQKMRFIMHIKPTEFAKFSEATRASILIHECLHILFNHFGRNENRQHELWNIACDLAINCFISDLPNWSLHPSKMKFDLNLSSEMYYDLLLEKYKNNILKINGNGTFTYKGKTYAIPDHSEMECDAPPELVELIKNQISQRAKENSRGNMPTDLVEMISKYTSKEISWQKLLKSELSNHKTEKHPSIKKRNRRFPTREEIYGKIKKQSNEGIVILDTSGSMSTEWISWTLGEIENLVKQTNSTITLIQNDAEVKSVSDWKTNQKLQIVGRGGTCIEPAIQYIRDKRLKPNFIIVITDGDIESSWNIKPSARTLFLLPKGNKLALKNINFSHKILYLNQKN